MVRLTHDAYLVDSRTLKGALDTSILENSLLGRFYAALKGFYSLVCFQQVELVLTYLTFELINQNLVAAYNLVFLEASLLELVELSDQFA